MGSASCFLPLGRALSEALFPGAQVREGQLSPLLSHPVLPSPMTSHVLPGQKLCVGCPARFALPLTPTGCPSFLEPLPLLSAQGCI